MFKERFFNILVEGGWIDGFGPGKEDMIEMSPEIEDLEDISMDPSYGPDSKQGKMQKSTTTKHK